MEPLPLDTGTRRHGPRARSAPRAPARDPLPRAGVWLARVAGMAGIAALVGCSGGSPQPATGPEPVRFIVEADDRDPGPLYVQVNTESRPVGWLTLFRDGESLAFAPRCEVPRCDEPAEAVCGAALPRVRELTGVEGEEAVEYLWDGHLSRTTAEGCELREPAPAGAYVARVCYARVMEGYGSSTGPGAGAELGHVRQPACVERPLTVPGEELVRVTVPPR